MLASGAVVDAQRARSRVRPSAPTHQAPAAVDDDDDDTSAQTLSRCQQRARRNLERLDHLGDTARSATERIGRFLGASPTSVAHVVRVGHSLSEAIARRLDCHEQQQAAIATSQAISGGVGTTARWTSTTRARVSGTSSVTAQEATAGGGSCVTVTDVIIIDGQETRAPKRMCRRPPSNRYVRV